MICREINVLFSRFEYQMFYVLYTFVTYLLTHLQSNLCSFPSYGPVFPQLWDVSHGWVGHEVPNIIIQSQEIHLHKKFRAFYAKACHQCCITIRMRHNSICNGRIFRTVFPATPRATLRPGRRNPGKRTPVTHLLGGPACSRAALGVLGDVPVAYRLWLDKGKTEKCFGHKVFKFDLHVLSR
jgi:hypothetical protein